MISKLTSHLPRWKEESLYKGFNRICLIANSAGRLFSTDEALHQHDKRVVTNGKATSKSIPLLILSRASYQERWESFPIKSKSGLRKVLRSRAKSPHELYFIGPFEGGQRNVLQIILRDNVQHYLSHAWFVIPESLIVARTMGPGLRKVNGIEDTFYVYQQNSGEWSSVRESLVVKDEQSALLALGGASSGAVSTLTKSELYKAYRNGLRALSVNDWLAAFSMTTSEGGRAKLPWAGVLTTVLACLVVYFSVTSLYMEQQLSSRQAKLEANSALLNESLQTRNQLAAARADSLLVSEYWADPVYMRNFWTFYADIEPLVTELSSIRAFNNTIRLNGQAESATSLLQNVMAFEYIESAEFTTPVRAGRRGQQFSIELQFSPIGTEPLPDTVALHDELEQPDAE